MEQKTTQELKELKEEIKIYKLREIEAQEIRKIKREIFRLKYNIDKNKAFAHRIASVIVALFMSLFAILEVLVHILGKLQIDEPEKPKEIINKKGVKKKK